MPDYTRHEIATATPERRAILEGIQSAYGFVPELFAYMIEAPVAVEGYLALNALLARSSLAPDHLQIALLAVSVQNGCHFCSVAHEAMARRASAKRQTIAAIKNGDNIEDPQDMAVVTLVSSIVENRGWVPETVTAQFLEAGFTRQQIFELILAVSIKTLSNYTNHLTRPEPNTELLTMLAA